VYHAGCVCVKNRTEMGGVLLSVRISAFLCGSAVNRLSAPIYRKGAEERRDTEKKFEFESQPRMRGRLVRVRLFHSNYEP